MRLIVLLLGIMILFAGCVGKTDVSENKTLNQSVNQTHMPINITTENQTNTTGKPILNAKLLPPSKGVYHCAYPDFGGEEDNVSSQKIIEFNNLSGKPIVWAYFSNNWDKGISFPEADVRTIHQTGAVPFVRLMPRSSFEGEGQDSLYTMQRIIDGDFDDDLKEWAEDSKKANTPLIIEFGTEVNGEWFPWNGKWNGGKVTNQYGDTNLADGPERFRDAYRHIIDLFRMQGATNITWVFHVDAEGLPEESWNNMSAYYPGDSYIDWIGISVYNPYPTEEWKNFTQVLDSAYPELSGISSKKPIAILEFGSAEGPGKTDKALWIKDALVSIKQERYLRIKAISYWHETWVNEDESISDLQIDSSNQSLSSYQEAIFDQFFVTNPSFSSSQ